MCLVHRQVQGLPVDFPARSVEEDWVGLGLPASLQDVESAEHVRPPARERILLSPSNSRDRGKMKDRVLPFDGILDGAVIRNVATSLLAAEPLRV